MQSTGSRGPISSLSQAARAVSQSGISQGTGFLTRGRRSAIKELLFPGASESDVLAFARKAWSCLVARPLLLKIQDT